MSAFCDGRELEYLRRTTQKEISSSSEAAAQTAAPISLVDCNASKITQLANALASPDLHQAGFLYSMASISLDYPHMSATLRALLAVFKHFSEVGIWPKLSFPHF